MKLLISMLMLSSMLGCGKKTPLRIDEYHPLQKPYPLRDLREHVGYTVPFPGPMWMCGIHSYGIYYTPDIDGMQNIINDAEQCREVTGDGVEILIASDVTIESKTPGPLWGGITFPLWHPRRPPKSYIVISGGTFRPSWSHE